ncbi:MAG: hypothetical protein J6P16_03165, partial [Eubacterium sp.]|nr:hypothetical protein [Eubacterium sp.]
MGKYIYKTVGLILIFIGALFFFGGRMQTNNEVEGQITTPGKETLPVIRIETLGHVINAMYGYTAPLSDNVIRESVTPIDQNREITLHITPSERRITGISYRITDKGTGEVYADEQVKGIDASQKEVPLKIKYSLATSTEYILDIMATLDDGREVHYYTRIKSYLEDSGIDAKLSFIDEFHQNTFSKNKITDVARYLETDPQARNSNLARVTINSSSDLVTWAGMSPKVISDEYITIKEYNMETAAVLLSYFVRANTNSGTETYFIREYYRVRHTALQDYLLAFERTMEADFDPGVASVSSSQLKLGITSDNKGKLLSTADGKGMYFARNEKVFYYDMTDNTIRQLYQIFSDDNDYLRRAYDTTDIRLVAVDEEDSLFFCALGYLPRGSYEGDIGIILYKYEKDKGVIELVNLPMETSYEQLFIDFENYSYVSPRDVFYFTVANTVYAYNISGQRLEILQKNVKDISFKTMESSNCYVWSSSLGNGYGKSITIYNLENDSHQLIQSPSEDEYIRLLGIIESNVVYGYVRKSDITRDSDGTRIIPCYQLLIADTSGTQVKTYEKDGVYIKNAIGSGNVVNIRLCRKTENGYKNAGEDSILNRSSIKASKFSYTSHLTTKSLTEWYVKFP